MRRRRLIQIAALLIPVLGAAAAPSTALAAGPWHIDFPTTGQEIEVFSPIATNGRGTIFGAATIVLKKGGVVKDSMTVTCDILGNWQHTFIGVSEAGDWQAELFVGGVSKVVIPFKVVLPPPPPPPPGL